MCICGFKHRSAGLALENSNNSHLFLLAVPVGKWIFYCNCEKQDELCYSVPKLKRDNPYVVFPYNPGPSLVFVAQQSKSCPKQILLERNYIKAFCSTGFIPYEWWWWSPEKSCCLERNLLLHVSLVCSRDALQI